MERQPREGEKKKKKYNTKKRGKEEDSHLRSHTGEGANREAQTATRHRTHRRTKAAVMSDIESPIKAGEGSQTKKYKQKDRGQEEDPQTQKHRRAANRGRGTPRAQNKNERAEREARERRSKREDTTTKASSRKDRRATAGNEL
ncbi:hypothetical protein Tco_0439785 [Tanacetum coccineum]